MAALLVAVDSCDLGIAGTLEVVVAGTRNGAEIALEPEKASASAKPARTIKLSPVDKCNLFFVTFFILGLFFLLGD
jgi:hypothetical protein